MRRFTFAISTFLILAVPSLLCQIPKEQVKWILPKKAYPAGMAGDTLLIMTTDLPFVFVYNINSDSVIYWHPLSKFWKFYKIEFDNETFNLALTYLTKDTTLTFELHSFELGIVSSLTLKFEKNKFPAQCYYDFKKNILYSLTNDFNFFVINLSNSDTLFNFFEDESEAEDLVYSFSLSDDKKLCGILGGKRLYLLDLENYKIEKTYSLISYPTHRIRISPGNKYVVHFGYDNTCDLIDLEKDTIYKSKVVGRSGQIEFTNDNKYLLVPEFTSSTLFKYKIPDLTIEDREAIAKTSTGFLKTQFEGNEALIISPNDADFKGLYVYYIDTLGPRKLLYISTVNNFYPCGQKNLIFVQQSPKGYPIIRNSKDGKLAGFFRPPTALNNINFSTILPYYFYSSNDTIFVSELFSNQVVKHIQLKDHNPEVIQFSNDLKYLLFRSNSNTDTCFKILNTETMEIVYEFKSGEKCILPQIITTQGVYNRLFDYGRFSSDSKYFGFTYRKSADSPSIFAVVDLEKGDIIFYEFIQSPFAYSFGDFGSDEIFIQNGSMQIRKVNLKTNETFAFPEVSSFNASMCSLFNRPQSNYLVQLIPKMDVTYMLIFNKMDGKIEKMMSLFIDSVLINEFIMVFYFNELYSLFYPNFSSYPIFAFWDSLTTVATVENYGFHSPISRITICPNPVNDILVIILEDTLQTLNEIEVFDILGRSLLKSQNQTQKNFIQLNVSSLPPGVYFIKINYSMFKFIKNY